MLFQRHGSLIFINENELWNMMFLKRISTSYDTKYCSGIKNNVGFNIRAVTVKRGFRF
jgi:hypothetical protein